MKRLLLTLALVLALALPAGAAIEYVDFVPGTTTPATVPIQPRGQLSANARRPRPAGMNVGSLSTRRRRFREP